MDKNKKPSSIYKLRSRQMKTYRCKREVTESLVSENSMTISVIELLWNRPLATSNELSVILNKVGYDGSKL